MVRCSDRCENASWAVLIGRADGLYHILGSRARFRNRGSSRHMARYYDPSIGRFISKDPVPSELQALGEEAGTYVYAGNNPVMRTDPSGLLYTPIGLGSYLVTHWSTWYPGAIAWHLYMTVGGAGLLATGWWMRSVIKNYFRARGVGWLGSQLASRAISGWYRRNVGRRTGWNALHRVMFAATGYIFNPWRYNAYPVIVWWWEV